MTRGRQLCSGKFTKNYLLKNLLDNDVVERVEQICRLVEKHDVLPFTELIIEDDSLLYRQIWIDRREVKGAALLQALSQLAIGLDNIAAEGFVHGDLNFKNVMYDGEIFRVVDLEPSLRQLKMGKPALMFTAPYIAVDDWQSGRLTLVTDKVGFYFFCRRLISPISNFVPRKTMNMIKEGISSIWFYTGMKENKFARLTFIDIFSLARNQVKTNYSASPQVGYFKKSDLTHD